MRHLCIWLAIGVPVLTNAGPALSDSGRTHWAFQSVRPINPSPPARSSWVRTPVDHFILAKLRERQLEPAAPADRSVLIRRVTFDLTGLPPTPEDVDEFVHDQRPDAYERLVERLLASPRYGERWAQHWLDVVRYAETDGYEADGDRPFAWRYRDYIIRALNADKAFDQFLTEQLAGDLLAQGQDPRSAADLLVATGFNRCGQVHVISGNIDRARLRQEVLTEMADGVGAAFLGLTVGCARCHDHKFDPISQAEYYSLQAFFAATHFKDIDLATRQEKEAYKKRLQEWEPRVAALRRQVADLESPYQERLTQSKKDRLEPKFRDALATNPAQRTAEQKKLVAHASILIKVTWDELVAALSEPDRKKRADWRRQIHELEATKPQPPDMVWAIGDEESRPDMYVLQRGDPHRPGARVQPAFLVALSTAITGAPSKGDSEPGSRRLSRLDLARWLSQPDHPLTARVVVNRLWQHHFDGGLVITPNDFGLRGGRPSHPELLDWLAQEFTRHRWSLKHLHRLMVLSATYRQSGSNPLTGRALKVDPNNRLLWRMDHRRLEGEAMRDAALAVSGYLNGEIGGPMVRLPLEPEVYELIFTEGEPDGLWPVTPDRRQHCRRSIYLFAKRNVRQPLFEAFDQPDRLFSCAARSTSTFAPQALILLNGAFMREQARLFATRLKRECGVDRSSCIERAYRLALSRPPTQAEVATASAFLADHEELLRRQPLPSDEALADFCLAILNSNEFLYVR